LKKLDYFFNILKEAFDNPLEIKWVDKGNTLIGLFRNNENVYKINCINKNNNIWKYDFYFFEENKIFTTELTGLNKDKYRVLPTIKIGIQYLVDNKSPNAIVFGAADKSKGRKKLYESFCIDFASKNNFNFYTKIEDDKQLFILFKDSLDKDILTETVIKIIDEEKFG